VITLAGTAGVPGAANGTGTAASFRNPTGVAVDPSGNVYVADSYNNLIREISPGGVVSTLAGSGAMGSTNATGTAASFNYPYGIGIDPSGNLYVSDTSNELMRKIAPGAVVSTMAGTGATGFMNGAGTVATFDVPIGLAVDSSGNVYVADEYNNAIREITPAGVVSTLAGSGAAGAANGTGTAASFSTPYGVGVDSSGNVYVADTGNNLVRKITPGGVVTTLAGSGAAGTANGTGTAASFSGPAGIGVDSAGNIYVGDAFNNLIRKITPAGVVTTLAGTGAAGANNGAANTATFNEPGALAVDASGNIYVADYNNDLIREIIP
jgi:sugar lactone lactonase YvrE